MANSSRNTQIDGPIGSPCPPESVHVRKLQRFTAEITRFRRRFDAGFEQGDVVDLPIQPPGLKVDFPCCYTHGTNSGSGADARRLPVVSGKFFGSGDR